MAELPIEDGACTSSLTFADYAFVLNKTALICRPNGNNNKKENGKGRVKQASYLEEEDFKERNFVPNKYRKERNNSIKQCFKVQTFFCV